MCWAAVFYSAIITFHTLSPVVVVVAADVTLMTVWVQVHRLESDQADLGSNLQRTQRGCNNRLRQRSIMPWSLELAELPSCLVLVCLVSPHQQTT